MIPGFEARQKIWDRTTIRYSKVRAGEYTFTVTVEGSEKTATGTVDKAPAGAGGGWYARLDTDKPDTWEFGVTRGEAVSCAAGSLVWELAREAEAVA